MITIQSITKTYRENAQQTTILKGISLHIKSGEFVTIVGKSGSGKSTLLNMITGVDKPTSGTITIEGTNIVPLNENQMALWRGQHLGIVFQFFQLIPTLSVIENVLLPMDLVGNISAKDRQDHALQLLAKVGLKEHALKMPHHLSGGEQQRVAIARALANQVRLLVADEPTGNLDSKNTEMILKLFNTLKAEGNTIVMVTHEKERIPGCTRQITVKDGEIEDDIDFTSSNSVRKFS